MTGALLQYHNLTNGGTQLTFRPLLMAVEFALCPKVSFYIGVSVDLAFMHHVSSRWVFQGRALLGRQVCVLCSTFGVHCAHMLMYSALPPPCPTNTVSKEHFPFGLYFLGT